MKTGFVSKLKPEIKGRVHADEVILKVKGVKCYYWGSKDAKIRFTPIPLKQIACAYFDENRYYEFSPANANLLFHYHHL